MILSSSMYEKTYLHGSLERIIEAIQVSSLCDIYKIFGWLDLLFKDLHQERKRSNKRIFTRLSWTPLVVVVLHLFIHILYVNFS